MIVNLLIQGAFGSGFAVRRVALNSGGGVRTNCRMLLGLMLLLGISPCHVSEDCGSVGSPCEVALGSYFARIAALGGGDSPGPWWCPAWSRQLRIGSGRESIPGRSDLAAGLRARGAGWLTRPVGMANTGRSPAGQSDATNATFSSRCSTMPRCASPRWQPPARCRLLEGRRVGVAAGMPGAFVAAFDPVPGGFCHDAQTDCVGPVKLLPRHGWRDIVNRAGFAGG